MRKFTSIATRLLSLGLFLHAFLDAQVNNGTILGSVTDPTGAIVAGARVTALNELTGFSRAEVLRRGLRSFAREQPTENSPMLKFMRDMRGDDWPADIARNHDKYLDEAHLDTHTPAKRRKKRTIKR